MQAPTCMWEPLPHPHHNQNKATWSPFVEHLNWLRYFLLSCLSRLSPQSLIIWIINSSCLCDFVNLHINIHFWRGAWPYPPWCNPKTHFLREAFSSNHPKMTLSMILYLITFSMIQSSEKSLLLSVVCKTSKIAVAVIWHSTPSTNWLLHLYTCLPCFKSSQLTSLCRSRLGYNCSHTTFLLIAILLT